MIQIKNLFKFLALTTDFATENRLIITAPDYITEKWDILINQIPNIVDNDDPDLKIWIEKWNVVDQKSINISKFLLKIYKLNKKIYKLNKIYNINDKSFVHNVIEHFKEIGELSLIDKKEYKSHPHLEKLLNNWLSLNRREITLELLLN